MFVCNHGVQWFLFRLVWAGSCSSRFSILCSLQFRRGQVSVISISFHGQWSKIASIRPPFFPGAGSGGWFWVFINTCVYFILESPFVL